MTSQRLFPLLFVTAMATMNPGCRGDQGAKVELTRSDFVSAYVELRLAESNAGSPADFEGRKASILQRYGTSREEMLAFVEAHAHDVGYMAALWDSVQSRIDDAQRKETAPPEEEGSGE